MDYTPFFSEIRQKLSDLARLDTERRIFAADKHQYRLNLPISGKKLQSIETQIGYQMPDQYRRSAAPEITTSTESIIPLAKKTPDPFTLR